MPDIQKTDFLVVNRSNVDYKAEVKELGIPENTSDLANDSGYITSADLPTVPTYLLQTDKITRAGEPAIELVDSEGNYSNVKFVGVGDIVVTSDIAGINISANIQPEIPGALIFRGTVPDEGSLPADGVVGDLYFNEDDGNLWAKGESQWFQLGQVDDVNLDEYARLDGAVFTGKVTAGTTVALTFPKKR